MEDEGIDGLWFLVSVDLKSFGDVGGKKWVTEAAALHVATGLKMIAHKLKIDLLAGLGVVWNATIQFFTLCRVQMDYDLL